MARNNPLDQGPKLKTSCREWDYSKLKRLMFLAVALSGNVSAQPSQAERDVVGLLAGTLYVKAHRESADGVQTACGLEFSALSQDVSTKRGAAVKIIGSYYVRKHPTTGIGYALKLGIYDGLGWTDAVAPHNAFVRAAQGPAPPPGARMSAETPGYALFVGVPDQSFTKTLAGIVEDKTMTVGFNRAPKQQDVLIDLDLQVVDVQVTAGQAVRSRSPEMVEQFTACLGDLLRTIGK